MVLGDEEAEAALALVPESPSTGINREQFKGLVKNLAKAQAKHHPPKTLAPKSAWVRALGTERDTCLLRAA